MSARGTARGVVGAVGESRVVGKSKKIFQMGVSKNRVFFPKKWMVYFMENPII